MKINLLENGQLQIENWNRQNNSVLQITKNGLITSDNVIKPGEKINIGKFLTDKQKYKINQTKEIREFISSNEGNFIHSLYKYCFPYMLELQNLDNGNKNNIHIIRFIVLCTYLSEDSYIRYNSRKITKSRLIKIWDLKDSKQSKKTYEKLKEIEYIIEDEEGYVMVNQNVMINGKVNGLKKLKKENENTTYTRLFTKNIQDMYYSCEEKKRKQLANLFKILPFVNFKYNVFCSNPQEIDEKKLQLLTWTDLTILCGYDKSKVARFKKDMLNLEIYKDTSTLGMFVGASTRHMICINPKIYYGGHDVQEVRHLYAMFKMIDNSNKNIN